MLLQILNYNIKKENSNYQQDFNALNFENNYDIFRIYLIFRLNLNPL